MDKEWAKILVRKPTMFRWYSYWRRSLKEEQFPVKAKLPWITFEAIDWLESYLRPDMKVFEWGSGGSTLFFAPRVNTVTTVEHDQEWYSAVKSSIHAANVDNVHLCLQPPIYLPESSPQFRSTLKQYQDYSFEAYIKAVDGFADSSFDLIMVDGRARVCCVERAINKVRQGGYLFLDNTEREEYLSAFDYLRHWRAHTFIGPVVNLKSYIARCTIWQKPQ